MQKSIIESPKLPPGPKGAKLSNMLRHVFNFYRLQKEFREQYGDIFYYETPLMNFCIVYDLDLMHEVFTKKIPDPDNSDGPPVSAFMKAQASVMKCPYIDDPHCGMNASDDEKHDRSVRLLAPSYQLDRFMEAHSVRIIENVRALHERWSPGTTIKLGKDLHEYMAHCIIRMNLGSEVDAIRPRAVLDTMTAYKLFTVLSLDDSVPLPGSGLAKKLLVKWSRRSLAEVNALMYRTIEKVHQGSHDPYCTASFLIDANRKEGEEARLSDNVIRDTLFNELMMSIDPPTYALMRVFGHVAYYPEVRKRLEQEVDAVLGDRPIRVEDYDNLPYANAIIKETLRLGLPTLQLPRSTKEDYILGGYLIPKGTVASLVLGAFHRDLRYWDRPDAFRPERWLEDPQPARPAHAYMPFGFPGPNARQCPAEEFSMRAGVYLLASTAQHLRLDLVGAGPLKDIINSFMLSRPKGPVPMKVKERKLKAR